MEDCASANKSYKELVAQATRNCKISGICQEKVEKYLVKSHFARTSVWELTDTKEECAHVNPGYKELPDIGHLPKESSEVFGKIIFCSNISPATYRQ